MLSEPLKLGSIDVGELFEYLYSFFKRDFVDCKTYLAGTVYVDPQRRQVDDGKEKSFWHLTSSNQRYSVKEGNCYVMKVERLPDFKRSERIEWVKQIIVNHGHEKVKFFYHKETTGKQPIRLYLWAHEQNFVVILQKLGRSSSILVTSFYIDHAAKVRDYQKRLEAYQKGVLSELSGCEWF